MALAQRPGPGRLRGGRCCAMTSTVKRSVPPPALVKMGNPLVRMLLGSPLHGVLDDSFLVLHLTGRKTGRRYDIPVG